MFEDISSGERQLAESLYQETYDYRFKGEGPTDTLNMLVKNGLSEEAATKLISIADQEIKKFKATPEWIQFANTARRKGFRQMTIGLILAVVGIAITAVSFTSNDGYVVITWGLIIFGIFEFILGIVNWLKFKGYISMNT